MDKEERGQKLTFYERTGLASHYDLTSAYPRQNFSADQHEVLKDLPGIFLSAHAADELEVKQRFEQAFFRFASQPSVHHLPPPLCQYSGSMALEIIANYLRLTGKTATLVQPTFDSLADVLKRHGIGLAAIDDRAVLELSEQSPCITTDALYIVWPNNPTGYCATKAQFTRVVSYCKKYRILLLLDFSFRFYNRSFWEYDQYQILQDAGIDFIVAEDTGKTWSTAEVKLGMLVCNKKLYGDLQPISDDFLVGVSPFVFALLTRYVELEHPKQQRISSQTVVDTNRAILRQLLQDTPLQLVNIHSLISVEWLRLPDAWLATDFSAWLGKHGVQLLPGERFYWDDYEFGQHFVRIALLRPDFEPAIRLLKKLALLYRP